MDTQELFITESWLREHCKLEQGSSLHVLENAKFTPAAYGLITDRKIRVRFGDRAESLLDRMEKSDSKQEKPFEKEGKPVSSVEVKSEEKVSSSENTQAASPDVSGNQLDIALLKAELKQEILKEIWRDFALTKDKPASNLPVSLGYDGWSEGRCVLCEQTVSEKASSMTHLGQHQLVAKNDAKLRVQGKLESAVAQVGLVSAQAKANPQTNNDFIARYLRDLRVLLIGLLSAIKSSEVFSQKLILADLNEEAIDKIAKNPLKYIGLDHFCSDGSQGVVVAQLDVLRTHIREVELEAAAVYMTHDFKVVRQDIMKTLNTLSHAVYVLMLFVAVSEKGNQ